MLCEFFSLMFFKCCYLQFFSSLPPLTVLNSDSIIPFPWFSFPFDYLDKQLVMKLENFLYPLTGRAMGVSEACFRGAPLLKPLGSIQTSRLWGPHPLAASGVNVYS